MIVWRKGRRDAPRIHLSKTKFKGRVACKDTLRMPLAFITQELALVTCHYCLARA